MGGIVDGIEYFLCEHIHIFCDEPPRDESKGDESDVSKPSLLKRRSKGEESRSKATQHTLEDICNRTENSDKVWDSKKNSCIDKETYCIQKGNHYWDGEKCISHDEEQQCKDQSGVWTNLMTNRQKMECVDKKMFDRWMCLNKQGGYDWNDDTQSCESRKEKCHRVPGMYGVGQENVDMWSTHSQAYKETTHEI